MSPQDFAVAVLHRLGKPVTKSNVKALVAWQGAEGGHWHNDAKYNPLNTTQPMSGAGNTGSQGNIKVYRSWDQGIAATVETLRNGHYGNILHALSQGTNAHAVVQAVGASPWGTNGLLASNVLSGTATPSGLKESRPGATHALATRMATSTPTVSTQPDTVKLTLANLLASQGQNTHNNPLFATGVLSTDPSQMVKEVLSMKAGTGPAVQHPAVEASGAPGHGAGVVDFEGKKVASWIAPALSYARKHGWQGVVNSGYRSFAEQKHIYDSGVRPAAVPGTSNHEGDKFPRGAVDVSNAAQLSRILSGSKYAHLLVWAGGKDPPHFSHPHNGSY